MNSAKLLGVTISNNLRWNGHINEIIKKVSKRLYFLSQLKRARVAKQDLVLFYTSCIRSILTYASPVFFYVWCICSPAYKSLGTSVSRLGVIA